MYSVLPLKVIMTFYLKTKEDRYIIVAGFEALSTCLPSLKRIPVVFLSPKRDFVKTLT